MQAWDETSALTKSVAKAVKSIKVETDKLDMVLFKYDDLTKADVKQFKMSPDAFVQVSCRLS